MRISKSFSNYFMKSFLLGAKGDEAFSSISPSLPLPDLLIPLLITESFLKRGLRSTTVIELDFFKKRPRL